MVERHTGDAPRGRVDRPVVVFDGDCDFCRLWIVRWRERTGERVEYTPFQDPDIASRFPDVPRSEFARAVHLIEPDGRVSSGALAVFRLLALGRGREAATVSSKVLGALPLALYQHAPGVGTLSEAGYRFVADRRPLFMRLTRWLWGSTTVSTFALSAWLFRRLLGLVYLIAFWSLFGQVIGLFGHDGILPVSPFMDQIRTWTAESGMGLDRFRQVPTLFWIGTSDGWLRGLCLGGIALSALLIVGVVPLATLPALWLFYLSFSIVGRELLSYQWDALLLEAGFLAIFVAPAVLRDRLRDGWHPPRLGVWLLLWLLARLMIGSGLVKLTSGDPTWRNLTALSFHYETQPIPTPLGWSAHQLPLWFHKASAAIMFGIEIGAPVLVLGPRRLRLLAGVLLVGLQVMFALTGNFAFFNLLTVSLAVLLIDDAALARFMTPPRVAPAVSRLRQALLMAAALVTLPVSVVAFGRSAGVDLAGLPFVADLGAAVEPFRSVNTYGLFAVMTVTRPEIIVEGSDDGATWQAYEFIYKVGDPNRRPPWVAPHQPRLDWQLWFAALGDYQSERWYQRFCARLLEGSPSVLRLLAHDPFSGRAPRYVRGVLYQYHFTDAPTRRATGAWWRRERLGHYSPVLSLAARTEEPDR